MDDTILDFNPVDIARDLCKGQKEGIFTSDTTVRKGFFQDEEVKGSLSYKVVKQRPPHAQYNEWRFHRILGDTLVHVSNTGDIRAFV